MSYWGLNKEIERERCSTKVGTHAQGRSQRCRTGIRGGQVQAAQTTNDLGNRHILTETGGYIRNPRKQRNVCDGYAYKHGGTHTHKNEDSIVPRGTQ